MLIPFGVFSAAGAGGGGASGTFDLISSTILTGSQSSVTFDVSTLASTYKHLQIRLVARNSVSATYDEIYMKFNSDSNSANYKAHLLYGNGSSVSSASWSNTSSGFRFADIEAASATSNAFTPVVADLLDPFSSSKNKTVRSFSGKTSSAFVSLASGLWMSTSTVTSIVLTPYSGSFIAGSRFSIYGIK